MGKCLTFCELKEREVINVVDGKRLGHIIDMSILLNGCVQGIMVPGSKKFFKNIANLETIYIPWRNIRKIGEDVILVELCNASVSSLGEDNGLYNDKDNEL